MNQTILPSKILVYIAEGYPIPTKRVGIEEYIYCSKGMVAQRASILTESNSDFILFLDDDLELAPNVVEKLYFGLINNQGDCIAADIFSPHKATYREKIYSFISGLVYPRRNDNFAFKVCRNASWSYNNSPSKDIYLSENAAGAISLWRQEVFKAISYYDETWLDKFGFAYGDEMLFYHKLHANNFKLLVHYNLDIKNLDAQSGRKEHSNNPKRLESRAKIQFILWHRTKYASNNISRFNKIINTFAFLMRCLFNLFVHIFYALFNFKVSILSHYISGTAKGILFIKSDEYRNIPNFIIPAPKKQAQTSAREGEIVL